MFFTGGVGWGEVINGGFGLLLDGSPEAEQRAKNLLHWDVNNGVRNLTVKTHFTPERLQAF